jgi:integrase
MKDGSQLNRSGRPYKPSTVRRYELAIRKHILPVLGSLRLADVDRARVRALTRKWVREGQDPSSIRNNLDPLRVIIREAVEDGQITVDPLAKLTMPQGRGRRDRVADRAEAQRLLSALPDGERALWACAFYGGLRRGELRALRWTDVDLEAGVIRVSRTWDDVEGEVAAKTEAGEREIPIAGLLRHHLVAHKLATGRGGSDLVFGRTAADPFISSTVNLRAHRAWRVADGEALMAAVVATDDAALIAEAQVPLGLVRAGKRLSSEQEARAAQLCSDLGVEPLRPITLHEARHSAASYAIEAGLNDLELTTMIGHSDPRTTKAIYGHLFPDSREKVAAKLDAYFEAPRAP